MSARPATWTVGLHEAHEAVAVARRRAAEAVAGIILDRWRTAGVGWRQGACGAPEPAGDHRAEVIPVRTSPSSKTLFTCPHCRAVETPLPPKGACPGLPLYLAFTKLARALESGQRYEPDAAGVPRPIGGSRG